MLLQALLQACSYFSALFQQKAASLAVKKAAAG
jgi:hypothetical protein